MPDSVSAQRRRSTAEIGGGSDTPPRLEGVRARLAGADAVDRGDREGAHPCLADRVGEKDPELAVTDLLGAGRLDELLCDPLGIDVVDEALDPHLRHEVDRVL